MKGPLIIECLKLLLANCSKWWTLSSRSKMYKGNISRKINTLRAVKYILRQDLYILHKQLFCTVTTVYQNRLYAVPGWIGVGDYIKDNGTHVYRRRSLHMMRLCLQMMRWSSFFFSLGCLARIKRVGSLKYVFSSSMSSLQYGGKDINYPWYSTISPSSLLWREKITVYDW